ncbi:MAG: superoxide dismutase family protein [Ruminococcus sp.]|jgi:Cu-Zn family superoxide dismutase
MEGTFFEILNSILKMPLQAQATIRGSQAFPDLTGVVYFYPLWNGTFIIAEIENLPSASQICEGKIFGFHIHDGGQCQDNADGPFGTTGRHFNPDGCLHPSHAGDLPPLFADEGYALSMFYTGRFYPEEAIGKTVVIHDMPDDFTSQPSGNSGTKIGCGEITGAFIP